MISFIIPCKNEEKYIGDCLASVFNQQVKEAFEVVVVDNNSTDTTSEVVRKNYPQVRIVREEIPGTGAARQKGCLEARGEILIFLDADVRLPDPNWLSRVLIKFQSFSNIVALSTHYKYYGLSWHLKLLQTIGTFVFVYPWIFLTNNILRHSSHVIGGMMAIKKDELLKAGGFSGETEFFGDETLIAKKLYPRGKIVVSPGVWVLTSGRRFEKSGMMTSVFKYLLNYFWTLFSGHPYHRKGYKEVR